MGKGDKVRPPCISPEEESLRWALATKKITFEQFETRYKQLVKKGKIYRDRPRYKLHKATGE